MTMEREITKLIVWSSFGLMMMLLSIILSGCTTTRYIPIESVRTEYTDRLRTDSIYVLDSIHVRQKGDSVWLTKWRIEYRDRLLRDSIFFRDSIQVPYPVERQLTKWEKIKMDIGGIAIGGMVTIILILIILYLKRRNQ